MSFERISKINNTISKVYIENIVSKVDKETIIQTQKLDVKCGSNCRTCLAEFMKKVPDQNPSVEEMKMVAFLGASTGSFKIPPNPKGPCYSICTCKIDSINMDNTVILDSVTKITEENKQKIVNGIQDELISLYNNEFTTTNSKQIRDIVEKISSRATIEIQKVIDASQSITIEGHGTVSNVSMTLAVNAVFRALVEDTSAQEDVSQIVSNMIEEIKKEVTKKFEQDFADMFRENKSYFIITGSILGFLVIVTISLYLYKNMHT